MALKFLKTESVQDLQIVARFGREAKAALSIKSEHVARILDVGTIQESGIPFIVMEYLEGQDFCTTLKQNGVFSVAGSRRVHARTCARPWRLPTPRASSTATSSPRTSS